ncbi:MAG TPA: hypothetical protein PLZ55_09930 [bacterium]|nr:hypothetical protein [bacterium]
MVGILLQAGHGTVQSEIAEVCNRGNPMGILLCWMLLIVGNDETVADPEPVRFIV